MARAALQSNRPAKRRHRWSAAWLIAILLLDVPPALSQQPAAHPAAGQADSQLPWLSINVSGHSAAVRALAFTHDSKRLCSAGLDKVVQVWNTTAIVRDLRRTWLLERSIRWQVGRGLRGSIYALAASPTDGLLALAGYGATGALGEILLVDPVQGTLQKTLSAHRQTVCSLAFSADGQWLASLDASGRLVLWKRGDWRPSVIYENDTRVYGAALAAAIARQPNLRPLTMLGSSHLLVPVCLGLGLDAQPLWKLQRIGLNDRRDVRTFDTPHSGMVSALAASADGRQMASADLAGKLYLGASNAEGTPLDAEGVVLSLCFDPRGATLVVGTAVAPEFGRGQLEVWDVATTVRKSKRLLADNVTACAVSPDGKLLACTGGDHHAVYLGPVDQLSSAVPLAGAGRRVVKVAFAQRDSPYRVAFGTTYQLTQFNDYGPLEQSFHAAESSLSPDKALKADDWLPVDWSRGHWRAELQNSGGLQLFRGAVPQGLVQIPSTLEGSVRSYCWIGDGRSEPWAIAVGTDVQNSIYVCQLVQQGACPVLRRFRGHNDFVASLALARDARYLASGSADGTIRFWSLSQLAQGRDVSGRWGAEFESRPEGLIVTRLDRAGPLFFEGVRIGDVLKQMRWGSSDAPTIEQRPAEMLEQLARLPWDAQIVFDWSRNGAARPAFQLLPAWHPLATLFVTSTREFAFWTPQGYYDASINGHTLFGWQVNRGLNALPDFYRADQFRKNLERPDVLQRLFSAGSVDEALRQASIKRPARVDDAVVEQIAVTPRIEILSPKSGETLARGSATVRARIRMPPGSKLARAKVFANGVVAANQRLIEQIDRPGEREVVYEWDAALPSDTRNLIQVVVDTDAHIAAFSSALVERSKVRPPSDRLPKLHLLAMGIDQYQDPTVQPLAYSVADAQSVLQLLRLRSAGLYTLQEPTLLTNQQATRANWREAFADLRDRLRTNAQPDDLLLIFMAGHGFVDPTTQCYYYAGYDLDREKYLGGDYSTSISWADFALLADIPCRKLVLLDTCHSGAFQQLRRNGVKAAVRDFQDDAILTVTAAASDERSEENADWRHGAFTKALLEVLSGHAKKSTDGFVTLVDVVDYVHRAVPELTDGRQNPTAAPEDLLPFISLRLTILPKPIAQQVDLPLQAASTVSAGKKG